jgi:ABC-2 type transport system ATP-binding protein
MRKKVQLAGAFMTERPLTLIDEPTNGLDPSTVIVAKQLIRQCTNHGGVIVSSHNLGFAQAIADQVLLLNTRPMAAGNLKKVLEDNAVDNLEDAYQNIMMTNHAIGSHK